MLPCMTRAAIAIGTLGFLATLVLVWLLFANPRPTDTTDPAIFQASAAAIDHCDLPELDASGLAADDIPKAYTPDCGWQRFPLPVLARCTEPLAPGAEDFRGLWRAYEGREGHIERIEQCGNRVIVTARGVIHDMRADGTLASGANDVNPRCMRIYASAEWDEGTLRLRPLGGPALVSRHSENGELVWLYPGIGTTRMQRICRLPPELT
jgi:hypothetical protein